MWFLNNAVDPKGRTRKKKKQNILAAPSTLLPPLVGYTSRKVTQVKDSWGQQFRKVYRQTDQLTHLTSITTPGQRRTHARTLTCSLLAEAITGWHFHGSSEDLRVVIDDLMGSCDELSL